MVGPQSLHGNPTVEGRGGGHSVVGDGIRQGVTDKASERDFRAETLGVAWERCWMLVMLVLVSCSCCSRLRGDASSQPKAGVLGLGKFGHVYIPKTKNQIKQGHCGR